MRKSILHCSMLCCCLGIQILCSLAVRAQNAYASNSGWNAARRGMTENIIAGKVTSSDGKWLAGVSVRLKVSRKGTSSDINGVFTIAADKGDVLIFSIVGYQPKEVRVGE